METKTRKPFLPRDKPKSWIVYVFAGLNGLLIAGPLTILGHFIGWNFVEKFGKILFILSIAIMLVMWGVFMLGQLGGSYKNITEKDWKDQIW